MGDGMSAFSGSWIPFLELLFLVYGFLIAGHNNVVPGGWFVGGFCFRQLM